MVFPILIQDSVKGKLKFPGLILKDKLQVDMSMHQLTWQKILNCRVACV